MTDRERCLTPEGIREMQEEARGIAHLGLKFDHILSSPYPRALETAQIVAAALGHSEAAVQAEDCLASGRFESSALKALLSTKPRQSLLFVGHSPDLSLVIESLCGGQAEMKKGSLACVESDGAEPGGGILTCLYPPSTLRRLGRS